MLGERRPVVSPGGGTWVVAALLMDGLGGVGGTSGTKGGVVGAEAVAADTTAVAVAPGRGRG